MPAGEVQFPGYMVERHAGSVERVSDSMETARSAVREVTMDTGAYGQLCQFLPGILSPVFGMGLDAMYKTVDVLTETAANLRATAADMSAADTASGQRITRAGNGERPALELPL
uniref:type VII secretion target n=1 Tax=Paractinoplanes polyasparticus TaxID=2856853 RepID=UPI001C85F0E9|nr:type VII secretion target [Actinoplanes polyasparticus]